MPTKRARRKFTDVQKTASVGRVRSGETVAAEARRMDISRTMISRWMDDERYQPDATSPRKKRLRKIVNELEAATVEAKPLIPSGFVCPHCRGPITIEEAAQ